jgi:mannosyltransferase
VTPPTRQRSTWADVRLAVGQRHVLGLAALTMFAAFLRFPTLDAQSFWFDEAVTATLARDSLGGMLDTLPDLESTPPLYYALAWLWARVFGTGEIAIRSLSALFGTATVAVVGVIGTTLVSRRVGLLAAAFAATSPVLVWYSQEARAYALLVLLSSVSLLFFMRALETSSRRDIVGWGLASGLALATHYFAVFLVAIEAVWLLVRVRAVAARVAVASVAGVGLCLLPLALHQERGGRTAWIARSHLRGRLNDVAGEFFTGRYVTPHRTLVAVVALLATIGLLLAWTTARERRAAATCLAVGVLAVGIPVVLAVAGRDYVLARNLLPAWTPLAVAVAAVLGARRARWMGIGIAVGAMALGIAIILRVAASPELQREDWRAFGRTLAMDRARVVVVTPGFETYSLELYRPGLQPLPPNGIRVRELIVAGYSWNGVSPPDVVVPAGFERADQRQWAGRLQSIRYVATRPVRLTRVALAETPGELLVGNVRTPSGDARGAVR